MMLQTAVTLLLLPLWARAQSAPSNVTTFGVTSGAFAIEYYRAAQNPTVHNDYQITGYNWSVPLEGGQSASLNTTEDWTLRVAYSEVTVQTSSGNTSTGQTTLSFADIPNGAWNLNETDWQLCTSLFLGDLPASISDKSASANDSSCAPYLGASCAEALRSSYELAVASRNGNRCPVLPALSSIDECKSVADSFQGGGIGTAVISTQTQPNIVYYSNNQSAYNLVTGATYNNLSTIPQQGLAAGQVFGSYLSNFPSDVNATTASLAESRQVRIVGLTISPSIAFVENSTGGYGWHNSVRLVCGRANATSSATSLASGFGPATFAALVVASLTTFW